MHRFHRVTPPNWILTGKHCSFHRCLLTALQKVTDWVQPFHCLLLQRKYSTRVDGFMHRHRMECAEGAAVSVLSKNFVVVVESSMKAKAIRRYLGSDFLVLPSYGHVRELAARAGSVRPDDDYGMVWEVPEIAQPHVARIRNAVKGATCLILATDPDNEGEAIAWHISEMLKAEGLLRPKKVKVERVVFNEITRNAVLQAMQIPRNINLSYVDSYLAGRALDYLISFSLSPLLWRALPGSQSIGSVETTALKLICDRETAVQEFVAQEYWTVELLASREGSTEKTDFFPLRLIYLDGQQIDQFSLSFKTAKLVEERLEFALVKVSSTVKGSSGRNPSEPYTSCTLQQDAQAELGFGAMQTMNLAQKLYEGADLGKGELTGLITHARTTKCQLSKEAVRNIRAFIVQRYGQDFVPSSDRELRSNGKCAQGAEEAIRPTKMERIPSMLCHTLKRDALALYSLIWRRTLECQMEQAVYEEVAVNFVAEDEAICLQATGSRLAFPGFLAVAKDRQAFNGVEAGTEPSLPEYKAPQATNNWAELSAVEAGDVLLIRKSEVQQHLTFPPARYSEQHLVQAMEELGIGRPSTYALTLPTLKARNYVKVKDDKIIPEVRGRMVSAFLSHYLPSFVDFSSVARLEKQLDDIAEGHRPWKEVLANFWPYFDARVSSVMKISSSKIIDVLKDFILAQCCRGLGLRGSFCPRCERGQLTLKPGGFGSTLFLVCHRYHFCSFKIRLFGIESEDPLPVENAFNNDVQVDKSDILLGVDPATNSEVLVKKGPFGWYIQLGADKTDGSANQLFSVPRDVEVPDITLEKAVQLMKFPRNLGNHPEDGHVVTLGVSNFLSYFVRHKNVTAVLSKHEKVEDMTLKRAVELLKGSNVKRVGRKSCAVREAEEVMRKLKEEKKKSRMMEKLNMSVAAIDSQPMKVAEGDGKSKKKTKRTRAMGESNADSRVGVGATVDGGGSEDVAGKNTAFRRKVQSTRA